CLLCPRPALHRSLRPFPTRRSSDLRPPGRAPGPGMSGGPGTVRPPMVMAMSTPFRLVSEFEPRGDQPKAIHELVEGLRRGEKHQDRKSTRLNSSHVKISYAVFCLKK